jgi:translation initiation factor 4E
VCHNIPKPTLLSQKSAYYIFKENIKPKWEDPENAGGGKLMIHLHSSAMKTAGEALYFDLLLLIIGNQLESADNVCGLIFLRHKDSIEIWIRKNADRESMKTSIIGMINEILQLKASVFLLAPADISYRPHKG